MPDLMLNASSAVDLSPPFGCDWSCESYFPGLKNCIWCVDCQTLFLFTVVPSAIMTYEPATV